MEITYNNLIELTLLALLFLLVYVFLYRKFIYSIVDPLFIFVVGTAFASVLVIKIVKDWQDILQFFLCQLLLWLGIYTAYRRYNRVKNDEVMHNFDDIYMLKLVTFFLFALYVISNIIIAYSKGFALFSDSPTEAKIANFQNGFGIFRKINWGVGTFVITSLFFLYIQTKKRVYLILFFVSAFFTAIEGSKSSVLGLAVSVSFILYHPSFKKNTIVLKKFKQYLPFILTTVLGVFFTVLIKEKGSSEEAFIGFFQRLLYSGDSIIYYYIPVNLEYFESFSPWDYIGRITNPILGFFRIQPYQEAIGNIMVENIRLPNSVFGVIVGPNTPYYIEGRIFFGYLGALPYCFFVGYLASLIRLHYFSLHYCSAFYFVFVASFCHLSSSLLIDVNMAVTQLFDLSFFVLPIFFIISLLVRRKIVFNFIFLKNLHNTFVR